MVGQMNPIVFPGKPRSCASGKGWSTGSKRWEEGVEERQGRGAQKALESPGSLALKCPP